MKTLEQRARSAADAVRVSTSAYVPHDGVADLTRRRTRGRAGFAAAVGIAVFAALLAGTWMAGPRVDEAAELPPPTLPAIVEPEPSDSPPAPTTPAAPMDELPIAPQPTPEDPGHEAGTLAAPPPTEPATTLPPETATTTPPDTTPPALAITAPKDGQVFDKKTVRFRGTTEPGATVTAGRYEADVDDAGNWSIVLVLSDGGNRTVFRAVDAAGNEVKVAITVYYEPPPEEPPPPPVVEFTAHATYGTCNLDPPYDVYYGTAAPESKVTITSEYGGGSVYANGEGNWELKVYFPDAPFEVGFLVTVKDELGHQKSFEFVSATPPPG